MIHIFNQHDPESALIHNSFTLNGHSWSVEKFQFDASYKTKHTSNNWKLVQFTFSHVIKADKKRKLKLKISNN